MKRTPLPIALDESLRERFWAKVDKAGANECWEWTAYRNPLGYGRIAASNQGPLYVAPRVSWTISNGPIPDGLFVCHSCDNPPCVNPAHLFLGTVKDNYDDMLDKGRAAKFLDHRALNLYCKRGHLMTAGNFWVSKGLRSCKVCKVELARKWRHANTPGIRPYVERTHCPQGHEYAGDNIKISSRGYRQCAECRRERSRVQEVKRKAARRAAREAS